MRIRRSGPSDRPAILELMDGARGDGLSAAEKAERGFVQGTMDDSILARFEEGPGVFVAEDGGRIAGFAMTSLPGVARSPAVLGALQAVSDDLRDPSLRLFLYGPTVVSPDFQGRGVLSALLKELSTELDADFDIGVAMVEAANERSMSIHTHYGMRRTPPYEVDGRQYYAFSFAPALFTEAR